MSLVKICAFKKFNIAYSGLKFVILARIMFGPNWFDKAERHWPAAHEVNIFSQF